MSEQTSRRAAPPIDLRPEPPATRRIRVKKYAAGQSVARVTGPAEHAAAAEAALLRAFTTQAVVLREQFREQMRAAKVPDEAIEAFLASIVIDDESYLTPEARY